MSTQTATERILNFSPGPAVLPVSVLEQIRDEVVCLPGVGSSVLEISHRGKAFGEILHDAQHRLRHVLSVPDDYEVLFLQGGAILQNAMVPANLIVDKNQTADYIITGSWGKKSSIEVPLFGNLNVAWSGSDSGFSRLPVVDELMLSAGAAYVHYTSNETIQGVQFASPPVIGSVPLVSDMSSDFLSRPTDVKKFGIIYACAQKNAGIAGLTVVVIRKDLLQRCSDRLPTYLNYAKHAAADSMANTPPTFGVYVSALICRWLQDEIGGLQNMHQLNLQKAQLLYDMIDNHSEFYHGHASKNSRSLMNVVFKLGSDELNKKFVEQAADAGMEALKGHRSVGGIRASIYNAMPIEGVQTLAEFMKDFAMKNG